MSPVEPDQSTDASGATSGAAPSQIAAAYRGVSKTFGVTRALVEIDLEIVSGTVHALVGENGAGKSTALGILAGRLHPTSGHIELLGERSSGLTPRESRRVGLAAIYQELTIVPTLGAEANVFVGQAESRFGLLSNRKMRRRYEHLCEELGVPAVPAGTTAGSLSVADQQLLEIMRAMAFDARIILFDEPTASLGITERRAMLDLMRRMRRDGRTIVFVSHNLDEVLEVADTITVFRGGRLVKTAPRDTLDKHQVVQLMLGEGADQRLLRSFDDGSASSARTGRPARPTTTTPVLVVEGLTIRGALNGVALEVRGGEILGLGGLVGAGRTSILRAVAGLEPRASGRMWIRGREVPWPRSVRRARAYGIALSPEDRKTQGLALEMPAAVNVTMSDLRTVSRAGWLSEQRMRIAAQDAAAPFGFDPARVGEPAIRLSGGNQQKLLLARWKHSEPLVLLADEPTRGIDIGAKHEVLTALERMADRGAAIVVVSSELEELVVVADRVAVVTAGEVVGQLSRERNDLSVQSILERAFAVGGVT